MSELSEVKSTNFIDEFIKEDMAPGGRTEGMQVHTRFPPEPNGYLHIGHAKAIFISFGTAQRFGGVCNLRMDDTNPAKEDMEYVEAIKEDIHWLGYDWGDRFYYASDLFEDMYKGAEELIEKGLAYVCQLTQEQMKEMRGDLATPARSPYRDRPKEESLDLFRRMRAGEFKDGEMTLRAKIDLASGNFNMRDPVLYRISHKAHHRTGDKWCIYPMYDYAHPFEDAMESITHSLCSLEFERHLRTLVEGGYVDGWDDPRMPTICGLRRRGYTPASIRNFNERNGVSKVNSTVEYGFLEYCLREDLNLNARRAMAVLRPVKLIIDNYPAGKTEALTVENNPNRPEDGTREVTFSRELWIEAEDFLQAPVPKYKRLYPQGPECRLKGAYLIQCVGCDTDSEGNVTAIHATYDPDSRGGDPADGRKVKGATLHWVDAANALTAQVRLYDNLFTVENPAEGDFLEHLNKDSLTVLDGCKLENALRGAKPGESFQFMRQGYFCVDSKDSKPGALVFNRSVKLKDSFKPA